MIKNSIKEQHFAQKIFHTSALTIKNLINFPHSWFGLNNLYRLYYKKLLNFFSDISEQAIIIKQSKRKNYENVIEKTDYLITYDISQIEITDDTKSIIEKTIMALNQNNLNRKCLCDAVLSIPLNTFSLFVKNLKCWDELTDYGKETLLRIHCWLYDSKGVLKLIEWKESYYSSINSNSFNKIHYYLINRQTKQI